MTNQKATAVTTKKKHSYRLIRRIYPLLGITFLIWFAYSTRARGFDKSILTSNEIVQVRESELAWQFSPVKSADTALIFLPGALIEPTAYAPLARDLARAGVTVYIVKPPWLGMPLPQQEARLVERVEEMMAHDTAVENWILSGHSRGGASAGRIILMSSDQFDGLILVGTSHPKEAAYDLSQIELPVIKIYASEDGLASVAEVEQNKIYLPAATEYFLIEGGNHAQFGWYGLQLGDQKATLERETQQAMLLRAILNFIQDR